MNTKTGAKIGAGIGIAGIGGYLYGVGVEKVIADEFADAIRQGNIPKLVLLFVICFLIWVEVHGIKKSVGQISDSIKKGFSEGESRFQKVESRQKIMEDCFQKLSVRVTEIEQGERK